MIIACEKNKLTNLLAKRIAFIYMYICIKENCTFPLPPFDYLIKQIK